MKAFVTGGSGFVGGTLIAALVARGDTVVALARSDSAAAAVKEAGAAQLVRGNLDAMAAMSDGMVGCDVVFHAAAVVTDWGDPALFRRVNVYGTANVIRAALGAGVPVMVHVSTEAVLVGGPQLIDADETWPLPNKPIGLYPKTKGQAEQLVVAANSKKLRTVIVRPRFVWGLGDTSLIPQIIAAIEAGTFMWIARGDYLFSTCHVDNLIEGMLLAVDKGTGGEAYFLTDGEPVQFRAFLTALLATQGVDPGTKNVPRWVARSVAWTVAAVWWLFRIRRKPPITRSAVRLIGEHATVVDAKARAELGYAGAMTRQQGLDQMASAWNA